MALEAVGSKKIWEGVGGMTFKIGEEYLEGLGSF